MQSLLDQVRLLQHKEQAQLAERGRQLREQQDLLLLQQGATLKKQQKQLQAFQNPDRGSLGIDDSHVSDYLTGSRNGGLSLVGPGVSAATTGLNRTSSSSPGFLASDRNSNTIDVFDPLGLGGMNDFGMSSRRGSDQHKKLVKSGNKPRKDQLLNRAATGFEDINNKAITSRSPTPMMGSRLSPSSLSASSSSSASSFSTLSLPSSRQSSSASSSSLLSSPLSSSASRIPDGALVSPGSGALGTRSVASSWSVAMLPGASGRSGPQSSHNSGHRGRPKLDTVATSRSDLRDVGLDKSRVYTREHSSSYSKAFNSNPLGLSLNMGRRSNAAHLQDDSSYTAYPVSLARPRYTSVVGGKNRRVVSNALSSRQPSGFSGLSFKPSFAVNSASSVLPSQYQRSQTHSANSNAEAYKTLLDQGGVFRRQTNNETTGNNSSNNRSAISKIIISNCFNKDPNNNNRNSSSSSSREKWQKLVTRIPLSTLVSVPKELGSSAW
ncbi:hypothetical protein ElyMa_001784500 [Elysia marginata]|uniref:Uncharacterized protein n=1 Tax=Elysia marginata TaxID=1093978 RepID=A0AAV4EDF2_9GAST|nr:hypothetical protein ElyMa_001784500 [Elysia marginata]